MAIRDEVREMRERERRQKSIIIRGLPNFTTNAVADKFKDVSRFLLEKVVELSCIRTIDVSKGIFRGDVEDPDRRLLLNKVSKLKNSQFNSIFISKDLTYQQRQELFQRRRKRSAHSASGLAAGENVGSSPIGSGPVGPNRETNVGVQGAAALDVPLNPALNSHASPRE